MNKIPGSTATLDGWCFDNTYTGLPDCFFSHVPRSGFAAPRIVLFNHALAHELGLDAERLNSEAGAACLAGNTPPTGATPIAQAYAGHQYGHFTMLGDGRAVLLGEHLTPDGRRFDLHLKGAGRTPYARGGDGRAVLGPMLREYVLSEAMHALGIPTTRSLAVVTTGERVLRRTPLPGAVLTRVASSHIRVGTFEYAARFATPAALTALAAYTLRRHFPECAQRPDPYLELFRSVVERQAALIAQWMLVGFVHGVMNTDNMAISGETLDYGPCAFIDAYDPDAVFSSIDSRGRYAFGRQPGIAHWNLARLAECLLPLFDADAQTARSKAEQALHAFPECLHSHWHSGMCARLGLRETDPDAKPLIDEFLGWMYATRADYTRTFCALCAEPLPTASPYDHPRFLQWHARWRATVSRTTPFAAVRTQLRRRLPALIPRNHILEAALTDAERQGDPTSLRHLLAALRHPYDHDAVPEPYRRPPPAGSPPFRTYCGT